MELGLGIQFAKELGSGLERTSRSADLQKQEGLKVWYHGTGLSSQLWRLRQEDDHKLLASLDYRIKTPSQRH